MIVRGILRRVTVNEPKRRMGESIFNRSNDRLDSLLKQDDFRGGIGQDERHLFCLQPEIDRIEHRTDFCACEERGSELLGIEHERRHPVPLLHTLRHQRIRQPVHLIIPLTVCKAEIFPYIIEGFLVRGLHYSQVKNPANRRTHLHSSLG